MWKRKNLRDNESRANLKESQQRRLWRYGRARAEEQDYVGRTEMGIEVEGEMRGRPKKEEEGWAVSQLREKGM